MASAHTLHKASDGFDLQIYRAAPPTGEPLPGLIIFPSIFGITNELAEHADEIAATGAVVVILNPFSRSDDPANLEEGDRERAFARMAGLDFRQATRDFREVLAALQSDASCNGRVAGLGICLGGPFVFNAAADGELAGPATWHGSRMSKVVGRAAEVKCPVLMDFGDADPVAPAEEIEAVRTACEVIPDFRLRVHAGAGHGFSHTGWSDHRPDVMAQARSGLEKILADLQD